MAWLVQGEDELELLRDLEEEQQRLEQEIKVTRIGNILDALGSVVSHSQVLQALDRANGDVDAAIHILAPGTSVQKSAFMLWANHPRVQMVDNLKLA